MRSLARRLGVREEVRAGSTDILGPHAPVFPAGLLKRINNRRFHMATFDDQLNKVRTQPGFIAALDQSGGSTPKALRLYGIAEDAYSNDEEMFALIHQMRTRIITSPAFNGDRILGAILFENTLDREIEGKASSHFLWQNKNVVPILKVDKGLAEEANGVQLMKPMPNLGELLQKAKAKDVFGTKMRSVIKGANAAGIEENVAQQFEIGRQIVAAGLVPIIEPEIDINAPDKAEAEALLRDQLLAHLDRLDANELVMFKLTLPEEPNFYRVCQEHSNMLKVVALSGGYSREEANRRLAQNNGMIASFSRALTEGLSAQQTDDEFNAMLDNSIQSIFDASST
jgi:fructose-bisphosphate aldolase class I